MAVFFFVVGLEIKRELVVGELSTFESALLPAAAAVGGAIVPAALYAWVNAGSASLSGWGIPMATDIAFALGVLSLFGDRVPLQLKVFLTALAIVDDMAAVLVIAVFYTAQWSFVAIGLALLFLGLTLLASRLQLRSMPLYVGLCIAVWVCIEASGIHATVAGVLLALTVPVRAQIAPRTFLEGVRSNLRILETGDLTRESLNTDEELLEAVDDIYLAAEDMMPPGIALERQLHPVQAFGILPLFALFAAGVTIDAEALDGFPGTVAVGVMLGLFFGKQLGILAGAALALRIVKARLPSGVTWGQMWAVSALGGIGFTMAIFIGELGLADPAAIREAKLAIIGASLASAALGAALLHRFLPAIPSTR